MKAKYFAKLALMLTLLLQGTHAYGAESPPPNETPLFTQAREAQNRGDWDAAIQSYEKYLETHPNSTAALHNLASIYLTNQLAARALIYLHQLVHLSPEDGEAYIKRGRAYAQLKDYPKAEQDFDKGVHLLPSKESYFYRAQFWFDRRDYSQSERDFEAALKIDPTLTVIHGQLAKAYLNEKKFNQALDVYTRGIELRSHPNVTSDFLFYRATVLEDLGQPGKALQDYNESIRLSAQKPHVLCHRGRLLFDFGEEEKGLIDMNTALAMAPNYGLCYAFRSRAFYDKDALPEALYDAEQAVKLAPNAPEAYFARGLVYSSKKEYQKSIEDYTKAIELNPSHYLALRNRAYDWALLQNFDMADADLDKSLTIEPRQERTYTFLSTHFLTAHQYDRTIKLASRGLKYYPDAVSLLIDRGTAYEVLKQYEKAIPDFELACKKGDKWGCSRFEWTKKALYQKD